MSSGIDIGVCFRANPWMENNIRLQSIWHCGAWGLGTSWRVVVFIAYDGRHGIGFWAGARCRWGLGDLSSVWFSPTLFP